MLQDRIRKKAKQPSGGGSLNTEDISGQIPDIDDVLAEVDAAIETADQIRKQGRGSWVVCCGTRTWVED